MRNCFFMILLSLFLILNPIASKVQSATLENQLLDDSTTIDEKTIDELLGPDTNFPFDPANHRDGSNPIKRIGPISQDNL